MLNKARGRSQEQWCRCHVVVRRGVAKVVDDAGAAAAPRRGAKRDVFCLTSRTGASSGRGPG